jgi:hypothetical protein
VTTDAEKEFKARLDALFNDATACARYSYTQATIDALVDDQRLRAFLNNHADFWNTVRSGLQASATIALGRIYDSTRGAHSANKVLQSAETYPGIFTREPLKARKIAHGLSEDDATAYVANAFEPGQDGLQPLREAFDAMQELYENTVQPVRHNVFAHAGCLTIHEKDELFQNVPIRDFERLVVFPLQLWDALANLFDNGMQPALRDTPMIIGAVVEQGVPGHTTTWAHRHAAASTKDLLEALRPVFPELYEPGT